LELIRRIDNYSDGSTRDYALVHNEIGRVPVQPSTNRHSRPRLIILLLLVAGVLSVLYYPYNSSFNPAPLLLAVSTLPLPFLVAVEGFYLVSGRVRKRELPLMFAFGIVATVISALFNTTLTTAGPCALGVSGSGFPLPWYLTFTHYTGLDGPPCGLSPDLTTYWRTFAFFSFLFDTIFYAGLAMSRKEIFAWFKGSVWQSEGSLPESPKESP
jgi:hypothetical protein